MRHFGATTVLAESPCWLNDLKEVTQAATSAPGLPTCLPACVGLQPTLGQQDAVLGRSPPGHQGLLPKPQAPPKARHNQPLPLPQ